MSQKAVNRQKKFLKPREIEICGERFTGWPGEKEILELLSGAKVITGRDFFGLTSLAELHDQRLTQAMFDIVLGKLVRLVYLKQVDFLFRFTKAGCHITNDQLSLLLNVFRGKIDGKFLTQICLLITAGKDKLTDGNLNKLFSIGFDFSEMNFDIALLSQLVLVTDKEALDTGKLIKLLSELDFKNQKLTPCILSQVALASKKGSWNKIVLDLLLKEGLDCKKYKMDAVTLGQMALASEKELWSEKIFDVFLKEELDFSTAMSVGAFNQIISAAKRKSITNAHLKKLLANGVEFSADRKMNFSRLSRISLKVKPRAITQDLLMKLIKKDEFAYDDKLDGGILMQLSIAVAPGKITKEICEILLKNGINKPMGIAILNQFSLAVEPHAINRVMIDKLFAGKDFENRGPVHITLLLNIANAIVSRAMREEQLNMIVADGIEGYLNPGSDDEKALIEAFGEDMVQRIIIPQIKDRRRQSVKDRFPKAREESQRRDNSSLRDSKKPVYIH